MQKIFNRYLIYPLVLVCLILTGLDLTIAAELKVAYVDAVRVIEEAPQAKLAIKKLEQEFKPRDEKLVAMKDEIKKTEGMLEKSALNMKESERRDLEKELLLLKRSLRRATQEFREDYNLRRNEELASLQKLVHKTIVKIAKKDKYDLVLHEGALYASKKIDITNKVISHLGKR